MATRLALAYTLFESLPVTTMGQHDAGKFWPQALCWRGDWYDDGVTIDSRVFFSIYGVTDLDNRGKCCCWPSHQEAALQVSP